VYAKTVFSELRGKVIKKATFCLDDGSEGPPQPTFEIDCEDGAWFSIQLSPRDPEVESIFGARGAEKITKTRKIL